MIQLLPLLIRFLEVVSLGAMALGGIGVICGFIVISRSMDPHAWVQTFTNVGRVYAFGCAVFFLGGVLAIATFAFWGDAERYVADPGAVLRGTVGTLAIVASAVVLFAVKQWHLRSFGVLKLLIALIVAYRTMAGMAEEVSPLELLGIVAGALGVIGGLDDLKKDLDARQKKCLPNQAV